jgi:hypothetical protein
LLFCYLWRMRECFFAASIQLTFFPFARCPEGGICCSLSPPTNPLLFCGGPHFFPFYLASPYFLIFTRPKGPGKKAGEIRISARRLQLITQGFTKISRWRPHRGVIPPNREDGAWRGGSQVGHWRAEDYPRGLTKKKTLLINRAKGSFPHTL